MSDFVSNKAYRRSDPIQGILFKTEPVLLQSRAKARASKRPNVSKRFLSHIPNIKVQASRLRRKPKSELSIQPKIDDVINCSLFNDDL